VGLSFIVSGDLASNEFAPSPHFGSALIFCGHGSCSASLFEKRVHQDLDQIQASVGLVCEHLGHQVLELRAEWSTEVSLMSCPKNVLSIQANCFIVVVVQFRHLEGLDARVHDEYDHSKGKDVRRDGLVLVAQ